MLLAQAAGKQKVVSNVWRSNPSVIKAYKIGYMRYFGPKCFDAEYYRENNWDQKNTTDEKKLWEHWVQAGQFEARPHR